MTESKIKTPDEIRAIVSDLKKKNRTIVFTNGCFDLMHYGHIRYLEEAKKLGDSLVVGLNSDSSVRRIKGDKRPLTQERDRARVLAALETVDLVAIFDEETPIELIKKVSPHVLVKGGDWQKDEIVGRDFVQSCGGKVVTVPYIKGYSTSALIEKIQKNK